ncbi:carboxypeptidase-like regulatory domain-containing protein [uncultured Polaribacter sp.]|uniref:carboxypeptidase-like regulatory domain-containing protein n=1 Tax=uncultured Polaribacter sp. TaxID=174711 RepID=UPI002630D932|nr:carboxypeptidase-like regulatory domain-containing protein [uncultured Polaribacter sp.]
MKKLILLFLLLTSITTFSQEPKRENIRGKIIVEGSDLEGITIYNPSSKTGTITNEKGEFEILGALNDSIQVRALEYKAFDFVVNKDILETKKMSVFLIEEINKLDEIVISSKKITGNLSTDIDISNKFLPKGNTLYFGIKNEAPLKASEKNNFNVGDQNFPNQTLVDGLNIINVVDQLLIPLFRSEAQDKKEITIPEVPAKSIKYYLGSKFLTENFSIPEHLVEEFIRYVEDDTFDFGLLNYGHEIEFLEILTKKSNLFLASKKKKEE